MKPKEPPKSAPIAEQLHVLKAQAASTRDPALKAAINKKIELLKTGKDIKK